MKSITDYGITYMFEYGITYLNGAYSMMDNQGFIGIFHLEKGFHSRYCKLDIFVYAIRKKRRKYSHLSIHVAVD